MRQLGNTLAKIAYEKAGIVKPGVPLVSGVTADEPLQVIEQVCRERGSREIRLGRDFDYRYDPPRLIDQQSACGRIDFQPFGPERDCFRDVPFACWVPIRLRTRRWRWPRYPSWWGKAGLSTNSMLRSALAEVRSPAQIEVVSRRPTVIIDAAHNVASVDALLETLATSFRRNPGY